MNTVACRTCGNSFAARPVNGVVVDQCPHCGTAPAYVDIVDVGPVSKSKAKQKAAYRAIPQAYKLANEKGYDLSVVKGTGKGGVITLKDVKAHFGGGD